MYESVGVAGTPELFVDMYNKEDEIMACDQYSIWDLGSNLCEFLGSSKSVGKRYFKGFTNMIVENVSDPGDEPARTAISVQFTHNGSAMAKTVVWKDEKAGDLYQFSKSDSKNFTEEEKTDLETFDESPIIDQDIIRKRAESAAEISDLSQEELEKNLEDESVRNQALYIAAKDEGVEVTEKELNDVMERLRSLYQEDSEYKESIDALCAGYDLSIDEYWETYREQQRYSMIINKYVEAYYDKMASEEKIELYTPEYYNRQKEWYNNLSDKMVQKYDVRVE